MNKLHVPIQPLTAAEQLRLIHHLEQLLKVPTKNRYNPIYNARHSTADQENEL